MEIIASFLYMSDVNLKFSGQGVGSMKYFQSFGLINIILGILKSQYNSIALTPSSSPGTVVTDYICYYQEWVKLKHSIKSCMVHHTVMFNK